jgi:hypothetical protein
VPVERVSSTKLAATLRLVASLDQTIVSIALATIVGDPYSSQPTMAPPATRRRVGD